MRSGGIDMGTFRSQKNIFDEIVTGILEILKEDAAAIILYGSVS